MDSLYVLLQCGLANRLRTLIGFWYIAEKTNRNIIFHWDTADYACNGTWNELFEPLAGLTIINTKKINTINYFFIGQNTIAQIITKYAPQLSIQNPNCGNCVVDIENEYYARLRPKQYILDEVTEFFKTNGGEQMADSKIFNNFVSMHIRRTDHSELAKRNNSYTTFGEFDKFAADNKQMKIFLATDDLDVQNIYTQCLIYKSISITNKHKSRQTTLVDAFIDVLIAAHCAKFKGSGFSSYSHLIAIFNRIFSGSK